MFNLILRLTLAESTTEPKQSEITHPTSFPSPHKQRSIPSISVSPNPFPALGEEFGESFQNRDRSGCFLFPPCQVPTPPRPRVPPNGFFLFFSFFRTVDGPNRAVPPTHTSSTSQPSNDDDCGTGHRAGHVALFDLSSRWLTENKCRGRWRVLISCRRYARNDGQCA